MLRWDQYARTKKCTVTRYAGHLFAHPAGSVAQVVHSDASGAQNVDTPFFLCIWGVKHRRTIFILRWDQHGFDRKRIGRCYTELVFLHPIGSAGHVVHSGTSGHETSTHYFSCSGETGTDATIMAPRHVTLNCVFASGGICGSRSALWCVRVAKCRRTICHARVGPEQIAQKLRWTMLR
jgi:hypothetical protein